MVKHLLFWFLFSGAVCAQSAAKLPHAASVAAQLDSATTQVVVVTPALRSQPVADALRRAALRDVKLYLLIDLRYAEQGDSYLPGFAGMRLAFRDDPQDDRVVRIKYSRDLPHYILVDDDLLIEGRLIEQVSAPFDAEPTYVVRDSDALERRASNFLDLWREAPEYVSFLDNLDLEALPY